MMRKQENINIIISISISYFYCYAICYDITSSIYLFLLFLAEMLLASTSARFSMADHSCTAFTTCFSAHAGPQPYSQI
jgi:hypothetical protein